MILRLLGNNHTFNKSNWSVKEATFPAESGNFPLTVVIFSETNRNSLTGLIKSSSNINFSFGKILLKN